jgi:hypothetical protein
MQCDSWNTWAVTEILFNIQTPAEGHDRRSPDLQGHMHLHRRIRAVEERLGRPRMIALAF